MPPMPTAMASARTAVQNDVRSCRLAIRATHQEPAMIATSLRSMPRLITISPIPSPRMPRMEMLRTSPRKLDSVANPGTRR